MILCSHIAVSIIRVSFVVGVLLMRTLLFGAFSRAPDSWTLPHHALVGVFLGKWCGCGHGGCQ